MKVSIIIPAFNAAETIEATLDSVIAQTYEAWEAIVVDDGSQDATRRIASEYVRDEPRIRLVQQEENGGVCAARNRGMAEADGELLLFLDADDLILERHLAALVERFAREPEIGAVYSGWARFSADGEQIEGVQWPEPEDAFQALARHSLFPIHSCMVRHALVSAVGGWDTSFVTCEDWDLWLRIARMGARFGTVPNVTALYRMRARSASLDGRQMLRDGLRVSSLACNRDPRVPQPDPRYVNGLAEGKLMPQRIYFLVWCAGIELGQGREATTMLQQLDTWEGVDLELGSIADVLKDSIALAIAAPVDEWPSLLPERQEAIRRFLLRLEDVTKIAGLQGEMWRLLEEMVLESLIATKPVFMRRAMALALDAEQPIEDLEIPTGIERALCGISMGPATLGTLQLPVIDGVVTAYVLRDAIAAEFTWPIMEQFLRRTVTGSLEVRANGERTSIWRGEVCLLDDVETGQDWQGALLRQAGWTLFLQELWGRAEWPLERFYEPAWREGEATRTIGDAEGRIVLEVSEPLPDVVTDKATLDVLVTVGGVPLGLIQAPSEEGLVRAQVLRAVVAGSTGFELCRAAVREGVLGQSLVGADTLRRRLADAATQRRGLTVDVEPLALVLGKQALLRQEATAVLERLSPDLIDGPLARRAALPVDALPDFERAGELFDQAIRVEGQGPIERLFYGPEVIARGLQRTRASRPQPVKTEAAPAPSARSGGRGVVARAVRILRRGGDLRRRRGDGAAIVEQEQASAAPPERAAAHIRRQGEPHSLEKRVQSETAQLPILMYHRIASVTSEARDRYAVAAETFEAQLNFLREAGYYSVPLERWRAAMYEHRPLPGKAVLITFDDGYEDFGAVAWPLLKQYGFGATLFLVAGEMGGVNGWDHGRDETWPLLSWSDVRVMCGEGLQIGAHSVTHKRLTALSPSEIVREAIRSRILMKQELAQSVAAFAYPYGSVNAVVRHLVGACGFTFGLTCETRRSGLWDALLALPRIEVRGDDALGDFVRKLGEDTASTA